MSIHPMAKDTGVLDILINYILSQWMLDVNRFLHHFFIYTYSIRHHCSYKPSDCNSGLNTARINSEMPAAYRYDSSSSISGFVYLITLLLIKPYPPTKVNKQFT